MEVLFLPCKHPVPEKIIKEAARSIQVGFCNICEEMYHPNVVYSYYFELLPVSTGSVEELAAIELSRNLRKLNEGLAKKCKELQLEADQNKGSSTLLYEQLEILNAHHNNTCDNIKKLSARNMELLNQTETLTAEVKRLRNVSKEITETKKHVEKLIARTKQLVSERDKAISAQATLKSANKAINKQLNAAQEKMKTALAHEAQKYAHLENTHKEMTKKFSHFAMTNKTLEFEKEKSINVYSHWNLLIGYIYCNLR